LTKLRKLDTNPPVWFLDVDSNGTTATLELNTWELLDPNAFQRACTERINMVPMMPKKDTWAQNVNNLLKDVVILDPPPADSSTEGQFWELLEQFCCSRVQGRAWEDVLLDKPFADSGRTYFRTMSLLKALKKAQFKDLSTQEIAKILKTRKDDSGKPICEHSTKMIGKKFVNLWSIAGLAAPTGELPVPSEINEGEKGF
jgi:hypothetical protein